MSGPIDIANEAMRRELAEHERRYDLAWKAVLMDKDLKPERDRLSIHGMRLLIRVIVDALYANADKPDLCAEAYSAKPECINAPCRSPVACNGFGYCRERNFERRTP